ncbi:MAG: aldehyde ferredoxin oxidoreductase C-terminal domain-containing protein [Candidatus Hodarchaeota archaeon]
MSKILRINMTDLSHKWENLPKKYKHLGGRGLTSTIIAEEVDPTCNPLEAKNKFIAAPGFITGTNAPSSGRFSVGAKSPLTGTIKEANAGGLSPQKIAKLGIRALIIEGKPQTKDWYNIYLTKDKCEMIKANEYAGIGLYELIAKLWEKYPNKPGIFGCGIAGQKLMFSAGIFSNNPDNSDPGRYAGRGGMGAVLGSKGVIAIIADDTRCKRVQPINKELFEVGRKKLVKGLKEHEAREALRDYGTEGLMNPMNETGGLPTRNWSQGQFEGAEKISGEAIYELVKKTKEKFPDSEARTGWACNPGCIIGCANKVPYPLDHEKAGQIHVSTLEYETAMALGSLCGIDSLYHLAELNRICNDLGLDTIETGNTIAVAMEAGLVEFGKGIDAIEFLKKVGTDDPVGRLIGLGAFRFGQAYGITHVGHSKGQALPAFDPRPLKGIGITYACSPMGGDHTAGYTIFSEVEGVNPVDPMDTKKGDLSRFYQYFTAFIDSIGYCLFTAYALLDIPSSMEGMLETAKGTLGLEKIDYEQYGMEILRLERDFNRRAGFTAIDDRLPEFFRKEPLPPHNVVFDVPRKEIEKVFKE